jgi:hypothetical protein
MCISAQFVEFFKLPNPAAWGSGTRKKSDGLTLVDIHGADRTGLANLIRCLQA